MVVKCATHTKHAQISQFTTFSPFEFFFLRSLRWSAKMESLSHMHWTKYSTLLNDNKSISLSFLWEERFFYARIWPRIQYYSSRVALSYTYNSTYTSINFGYGSVHRLSITFSSMKFPYISNWRSDFLCYYVCIHVHRNKYSDCVVVVGNKYIRKGKDFDCMYSTFQTQIYYTQKYIFNERTKLRLRWTMFFLIQLYEMSKI